MFLNPRPPPVKEGGLGLSGPWAAGPPPLAALPLDAAEFRFFSCKNIGAFFLSLLGYNFIRQPSKDGAPSRTQISEPFRGLGAPSTEKI